MSVTLGWGSRSLVSRLIREVLGGPLDRPCLCPTLLTVKTWLGREYPRPIRCARPEGHLRPHRTSDGRTGEVYLPSERDPVLEAQDTIRRAERAVRRSKRGKGKR